LSESDRAELLNLLSSRDPREFVSLTSATSNRAIKELLPFYIPMPKDDLFKIWDRTKRAVHGQKVIIWSSFVGNVNELAQRYSGMTQS
jgi:hypothetical protein